MSSSTTGRILCYPAEVLLNTDLLRAETFRMADVSCLSRAILGYANSDATLLAGLNCIPTSPLSFAVKISAGSIYSLKQYDSTAYPTDGSGLPADTTQFLFKQGINLDETTVSSLTAPVSGNLYYLIQMQWATIDTDMTTRQYYNPAAPATAITASNNETRKDYVNITVKSSSSVIPTPDAGFVGAWVVTVPSTASNIDSSMIAKYSAAPFIDETLTQKLSYKNFQNSSPVYGLDTGTTNAVIIDTIPTFTELKAGSFVVAKISNTNSGASTITVGSMPSKSIVTFISGASSALSGGEMPQNGMCLFYYNGSTFDLINPSSPNLSINKINLVAITATATYTPSAGIVYAIAEIVGAGGGGGGADVTSAAQSSVGGGGGAGGYSIKKLTAANIGVSKLVTIGIGGPGGSAGASNNGSVGGNTTFGSIFSANGGLGGLGGPTSASTPLQVLGGEGGTSSGGDLNIIGGDGMAATTVGAQNIAQFPSGGASKLSGSAMPTATVQAGLVGHLYGGGGTGGLSGNGTSAVAGGNGANGVCLITEYIHV